MEKSKQKAIIAGAGPAGLTAAATFLDETNIQPVVLERPYVCSLRDDVQNGTHQRRKPYGYWWA